MKEEEKDNSLIIKIDNLTDKQSRDLSNEVIKKKDKIAPESRGTIVRGKTKNININSGNEIPKIGGNNKNGKKKK